MFLFVCDRFAVLTGLTSKHESIDGKLKSSHILKVTRTLVNENIISNSRFNDYCSCYYYDIKPLDWLKLSCDRHVLHSFK